MRGEFWITFTACDDARSAREDIESTSEREFVNFFTFTSTDFPRELSLLTQVLGLTNPKNPTCLFSQLLEALFNKLAMGVVHFNDLPNDKSSTSQILPHELIFVFEDTTVEPTTILIHPDHPAYGYAQIHSLHLGQSRSFKGVVFNQIADRQDKELFVLLKSLLHPHCGEARFYHLFNELCTTIVGHVWTSTKDGVASKKR
jgi:hypothetical protein